MQFKNDAKKYKKSQFENRLGNGRPTLKKGMIEVGKGITRQMTELQRVVSGSEQLLTDRK